MDIHTLILIQYSSRGDVRNSKEQTKSLADIWMMGGGAHEYTNPPPGHMNALNTCTIASTSFEYWRHTASSDSIVKIPQKNEVSRSEENMDAVDIVKS